MSILVVGIIVFATMVFFGAVASSKFISPQALAEANAAPEQQ